MRALLVKGAAPHDSTLRAALQTAGYEVVPVSTGLEALQRLEHESFDLIVTESLPLRVDALVLCRDLRRRDISQRIPVLHYTDGAVDPGAQTTAAGLDVDALIVGPLEPAALAARIQSMLHEFAGKTPRVERRASTRTPSEPDRVALQQKIRWLEEVNRELTAREAHLLAIIENEPECVKLLAADGSLLEMNSAGLRMLEADSFAQVQNQCIYPLVAEEDREAFRALTERVLSGASGTLQFRVVGLKGGRRWLETHASPLRDASGVVTALLGITRDITEQKRVDQQLRQSTERFELLAKATNDAVWDWDFEHNIVWWGEGFEALFGYRRAEVEPGAESWYNRIHADDRERVIADIRALIDSGGQMWSGEYRFRRQIGSYADIFDRGFVTHDPQGKAVRMVGVMMDITERKRTQQALQQAEARLRLALQAGHTGIWDWDLSTDKIVWSRGHEEIWGMAPGSFQGTYAEFDARLHPDDRAELNRAVEQAVAEHRTFHHEFRIVWPDRSVHWIAAEGEAFYDAAAKPQRMVGVVRDITERKRSEQALRQSEERFALIFQASPIPIALTRLADGLVLDVNDSFVRLSGFTRAEILGRTMLELKVFPDPQMRSQILHGLRERGRLERYEFPFRNKSGQIHDLLMSFEVVTLADEQCLLGLALDITERKRAEDKVRRLNRVYAMLSGINALIVRVHHREELFQEACRLAIDSGQFRLAWIGVVDPEARCVQPVAIAGSDREFLHIIENRLRLDDERSESIVARAIKDRQPLVVQDVQNDARILHKEAHAKLGLCSVAMLPLSTNEQVFGVLALGAAEPGFFDAEEMRLLVELAGDIGFALDHIEKEERINYLAYYDSLTGLANSTLFHERLTQYIHAAEVEQRRLAVCLMDLDHFKTVNDVLGRQVGDTLLAQIAQRLVDGTGDPTRVARLGADRFAVAMPDAKDEAEVLRVLEHQITGRLGEPFMLEGKELQVTAKIGIALYPNDGAHTEALFHNAEAALKKAKAGGDRYLFYTQEMTNRVVEKLDLENKLRRALEREQFTLHYQPQVDARTGNLLGLEALIRWIDPDHGMVLPAKFIPLLEETGIIVEVGQWVLQRAADDYRYWQASGFRPPRIAVNVSAVQLRQRDFVETVREALGASGATIELEITESLLMENVEENIERLKRIHDLGITLAIDDFGTGYSSLGYLTRLPVQVLKIDLSFIARMLDDPDVLTLVSTMISLAHSMRLKVVAEGVETERQADVLRQLKCDELQGYLISAPLPRDRIGGFLRAGAIRKKRSGSRRVKR